MHTLILETLYSSKLYPIFVRSLKFKSWMLSNLHFESIEKHDFVLRNLPNGVHPKWVGGTIPFSSFSGVGVKHGIFGAQNFLIVQLSLKSKTFYLIFCNIYFSLNFFMSDWQFRIFIKIQTNGNLNNSRQVWASLENLY